MGGYVSNILQQLPLMEESKAAVFDHFIDYASTESSGTWPFALINLIDSYSSTTLSKTISNRFPGHTDFDADTIKKKKSVIVRLRLHPSQSHSLAPFSLWYHIVVSRSNY